MNEKTKLVVRDLTGTILNSTSGLDPEYPNHAEDEFYCLTEEESWIEELLIAWMYPNNPGNDIYLERTYDEDEEEIISLKIMQNDVHLANVTLE